MSAMTTAALTEIAVGGARSSIDGLDAARQDLSASRTLAERAQAKADKQRSAAEQQRPELANAISLSQKTQSQLDDRIDQNLAEAGLPSPRSTMRCRGRSPPGRPRSRERLRKSQEEATARAAANPGLSAAGGRCRPEAGHPAAAGNLVTVHGIPLTPASATRWPG